MSSPRPQADDDGEEPIPHNTVRPTAIGTKPSGGGGVRTRSHAAFSEKSTDDAAAPEQQQRQRRSRMQEQLRPSSDRQHKSLARRSDVKGRMNALIRDENWAELKDLYDDLRRQQGKYDDMLSEFIQEWVNNNEWQILQALLIDPSVPGLGATSTPVKPPRANPMPFREFSVLPYQLDEYRSMTVMPLIDAVCTNGLQPFQCNQLAFRLREVATNGCAKCAKNILVDQCPCGNFRHVAHDTIVVLPCCHFMHLTCVSDCRVPAVDSDFECPVCRISIRSSIDNRRKHGLLVGKRDAKTATPVEHAEDEPFHVDRQGISLASVTFRQLALLERAIGIESRQLYRLFPNLITEECLKSPGDDGEDATMQDDVRSLQQVPVALQAAAAPPIPQQFIIDLNDCDSLYDSSSSSSSSDDVQLVSYTQPRQHTPTVVVSGSKNDSDDDDDASTISSFSDWPGFV